MLEHNQMIKESWGFFKDNFFAIVKFMLPIIIVTSIIGDILIELLAFNDADNKEIQWLTMYGYFLIKANFYALDVALFLHFMKNFFDDSGLSSKQMLFTFLPRLPLLFILTTLAATAIFGGIILLIIPGIYIAFRFSFAWMYFTFDNINPISSLIKSFRETKESAEMLLKAMAVVIIPFIFFMVFYIIIASSFLHPYISNFILSILSSIVFLFLQVVIYRIYSQYGHEIG